MLKRRRQEEPENQDRWLVSYADFMTLLFAFFTVLYATSQSDTKKQEQFEHSIKQNMSFGLMGGNDESFFDNINRPTVGSLFKPLMLTYPKPGASSAEVENYVEAKLDKSLDKTEKEQMLGGLHHDSVGVRIQIAANRLFPSGSAELRSDSLMALDKIADILKDSRRRLIVEGHTDDQPIRNEHYPSNWELSAARATKIVRYLIMKHQIPAERMTAVAYADQKPLVPNDSEVNRSRNRRIEVMIVTGEAKDDQL